jgi:simple sugar transport system ATP-binding protein
LALDAISFDVKAGEIHCLLGENGAGKSTLAECLYGIYKPDFGRIYLNGEQVTLASPAEAIRHGIGMVHQHFVLVPPLTVVENIIVGKESQRLLLDSARAERELKSLCQEYGVDLDLRAEVRQLSVGQQQWVEILKALYVGAELLILDEPTAVLTPQEAERLFAVLRQMTAEGLSIIFITHKLREVMDVSDRVTVLRKGKYVGTVNTEDVSREDLARMMVGRDVVLRVEKEEHPSGEPILEIRNLHAQGDRGGRETLQGVTLTLNQGEILGVAGVSGNGQKELFDILVGVKEAVVGQVLLDGQDISACTPLEIMDKGMSHIPEDRMAEGLVLDFTVAENLILGLHTKPPFLKGIFLDDQEIIEFASKCISDFDIATPSSDQTTRVLSGGNMQKVILARELAERPKCLIANQPVRGLDVAAIEFVHNSLLELRKNGVGILLFSEDLEEIFTLADRIAVIFQGRIMRVFDVEEASMRQVGLLMAGIEEETS